MRRGNGFTLVDLLVVVMVLAVVVIVSIPSLSMSRELASQMGCRSNLHSLSKSMFQYCEANNDYWPPYRMGMRSGQPAVLDTFTCIERTMWAAKEGDLDPGFLHPQFRGVGIMYSTGYVGDPSKFYCPAQTEPWFVYDYYTTNQNTGEPVEWGTYDPWSNNIRTGYFFQTWGRYYSDEYQWDIAFRTLSSMESDKAMAIDHAVFPWADMVHPIKGTKRPELPVTDPNELTGTLVLNVLHPDGHVSGYVSSTINDALITEWGSVLKNWADCPGDDNDWNEIYTLLQSGQ